MGGWRAIVFGMVAPAVIIFSMLAVAQEQKSLPPRSALVHLEAVETSSESHEAGVNVVRRINTAEVSCARAHGNYATWDELFRSGAVSEREKPGTMFQGLKLSVGPQVVRGWILNQRSARRYRSGWSD